MNAQQTPIVTRESLQVLINAAVRAKDNDKLSRIIGRALVVLLNRQTASEQKRNDTEDANTVGFAASDAKSGSLTAKSFIKRGTLEQWQLDSWTRPWRGRYSRICKYARQLNEAAIERAKGP